MTGETSWDFRERDELSRSRIYVSEGYLIADANISYIEDLKADIENAFNEFNKINLKENVKLENAHQVIDSDRSNELQKRKTLSTHGRNQEQGVIYVWALKAALEGRRLLIARKPTAPWPRALG